MPILITYVLVALVFSFLCSVAEAVILSVSPAHVATMEQDGKPSGAILRKLKEDVNKPLAAILTLNTIAHTVGAAGAGAQAARVFGSAYVGVFSAFLTLLILVFSEIIPKTLGAHYWRALAPVTAHGLKWLVFLLYPFVYISVKLTAGMTSEPARKSFNRNEFAAMAELSAQEGQLGEQESTILKNLLLLRETRVMDVMTPNTVIFSLPQNLRVEEFFHKYDSVRFSRIPIYNGDQNQFTGFVLRSDLLLAQARGNVNSALETYGRELPVIQEQASLSRAFEEFMQRHAQIMLVVDEYGGTEGLLTLEDLIETLIGIEIVDEGDREADMQQLARKLWKRRAREMGIDIEKLSK